MEKFTKLLEKENVALVMREHLKPVEGEDAIIYPPTYADIGYNIDTIPNKEKPVGNVCVIDSVGSQANRMEPIFKNEPFASLVPRISIEIHEKGKDDVIDTVNILDAGHRIADAVVRFSNMADDIEEAFNQAKIGNALPLAKMAPTSLVFGCWDSRGTGVKIKRIVRSTIRAHDVSQLTRSAAYFVPTDQYAGSGAISEKDQIDADKASAAKPAKASTVGLANALSNRSHGGILLSKDSRLLKESVLSLSALRQLRANVNDNQTKTLQKYILGLSLIAVATPQEHLLRMGCELTRDPEQSVAWNLVKNSGIREEIELNPTEILSFAKEAATNFVVGNSRTATFDAKKAREALSK